jgi:RNA recognition motif-containing protein
MPYEATSKDVEKLLEDVAAGIQAINISVDPMTGRNPSYCFVDFKSKELAEQVMEVYDGRDFMRRPLKVKPGVRSGTGTGRYDMRPESKSTSIPIANPRWNRLGKPEDHQVAADEGRRLYVGGLPRFENQEETGRQIRSLFEGFNVEVVSKLLLTNEFMREKPGNHNYCFVDVASAGDAEAAIQALNGKEVWGWHIKVNHTTGASGKLGERRRLFVSGLPEFADQDATEASIKELFEGFEVSKVSRLFLPRESSEEREGSHCYCFVELADEQQTDRAILELDWKEKWDRKVRVKPATSNAKGSQRAGFGGWGSNMGRG